MTTTRASQRPVQAVETSDALHRKARQSIPIHVPPVPISRAPQLGACACGGSCPRCAAAPTFSSLVRSATEETGNPLPSGIAHRLQSRFHQTIPNITTHKGPQAERATKALGTRAFTSGNDLVFSEQAPDFESPDGFSLLVHETTHVLQQRSTKPQHPSLSKDQSLEQEAIQASDAAREASGPVAVKPDNRGDGKVQREDPPIPDNLLHPFTSQGMFQLQLSPEIELELFRLGVRQWIVSGEPSTTTVPEQESELNDVPSPEPESDRPLPSTWVIPDTFSAGPDVLAPLGAFNARGVQAGAGDVDMAARLFQDRYRFILGLPDVRDIVPDFARTWIPPDWRIKLAESLTNMTIDASLRHDHPTLIEATDQFSANLTGDQGVVPTYFSISVYSF